MTIARRILFGAAASWFSRGLTIVLGLVLMPVLFRTLPHEELGLWLLLGQSWATLGILDFGFGVTLTRRIAFAKGKSGSAPTAKLGEASRTEIADLVATGLRLYRGLALLAFAVSTGLGLLYLRSLELETVSLGAVWTGWALLCLAQALTLWAAPWTCLLQGVGHVGWDALVGSFVHAITLLAQIAVALAGGGLVALAFVAAAGALVQRAAILGFAKRKQPDLFSLRGRWRGDMLRSMAPLAGKAWLTAFGGILALNTDQFFVATFEGTRELPAYRAAYVLLLNLNIAAVTFASASAVFVSHLWTEDRRTEVQDILINNLRIGLFLMAAGGGWLLGAGNQFFALWLGPGNFVGTPILAVFFVLLLLETQCFICSTASRATEDEAFASSSISGGLLKLLLSWILVKPFGLLGVALATLAAQFATNHWFMVWRSFGRLGVRTTDYAAKVALPTIFVFLAASVGTLGIVRAPIFEEPLPAVACSAMFAAAVLFGFAWCLALKPLQRQRLLDLFRKTGAAD